MVKDNISVLTVEMCDEELLELLDFKGTISRSKPKIKG